MLFISCHALDLRIIQKIIQFRHKEVPVTVVFHPICPPYRWDQCGFLITAKA
jgi:hypothetical protein